VKHKDVEIGVVKSVELAPNLEQVIVIADMHKEVARHLNASARFWVVRPRLGAAGVSGLETIISGAYIEMEPGQGASTRKFQGLEEPPVVQSDVPGREFLLRTNRAGSLGPHSPIFFRGVKVGEVLGVDYTAIQTEVIVHIFVQAPYDKHVYPGSRFWNASGISINTGPQGFRIQMESLQAILAGGIAFDTAETARLGAPAAEKTAFVLYSDEEAVAEAAYTIKVPYLIYFDGSVHGLEVGATVELLGIKIGRVTDIHLEYERETSAIRVPVTIEVERQRIVAVGTPDAAEAFNVLARLVERGLRGQIRTASLITGQRMIAFDFFPDAPKAEIKQGGQYPELPTVPTDIENIVRSVNQVLERLATLPLDGLVEDLRATLRSFRGVAEGNELKASLRSLDEALASVASVARKADAQIGPILIAVAKASGSADSAVKQAELTFRSIEGNLGRNSAAMRDLTELMEQLTDAARAIRVLAEYLEQHPDALVRGKVGRGN
jgi:paraquat-inducible protein B